MRVYDLIMVAEIMKNKRVSSIGFKAQAFVGWETKVSNRIAIDFDKQFWKCMSSGYTSDSAAFWAYVGPWRRKIFTGS